MRTGKQQSTWAQAAGKGLNNNNNGSKTNNNTCGTPVFENESGSFVGSASKVMKMADPVNESQIAAAFSEGWGQRGVNQETAWEVPTSPQCSPKEGSNWNSSTSTGTEIWENNFRHHSKVPPANNSGGEIREPWGHTPSTHIGGTWGEDDEPEDFNSLWTGVPPPPPGPGPGYDESNAAMWAANPNEEKNWNNQNSAAVNFSTWGNDAAPGLQIGLAHLPLSNEPKTIVSDNNVPDGSTGVWADPAHKRTYANWSPITGPNKKPAQPSGWEETAPPPVTCQSGNFDDGTAVWGNPVHQGKVSNWKEMPQNKQMANCIMQPGNMCATGNPCTGPGMIRLPSTASNVGKNENYMKSPAMNRGHSWNDVPPNHRDASGRRIWDDIHNQFQDKNVPGTPNSAFGSWADPNNSSVAYWGAKSKNTSATWADGQVDTSSWGGPLKQASKPLSRDLIWASKQFRLLCEMNFKKDDVENALRHSNMNIEEALMELHAMSNKESSGMDIDVIGGLNLNQSRLPHSGISDELNFSDQSLDNPIGANIYGSNNFPGMAMFSSGFNMTQNCKNQTAAGNNVNPMLGNTTANNQLPNFNLNNGLNNMSPAMMRKIFQQNQAFNPASNCIPPNVNNQNSRANQQNMTSSNQLRLLVQQIQMAVQAGHLNPQILNQPLAPQTFQLLSQLLQQIRNLHQLHQQQLFYTQHGIKPNSPPMQLSVSITQTKQHLVNLQNQIAAQQAIFLKQQNAQLPMQHPSLQTPQPSAFEIVKSNLDSINGLHMDFRDLSVKDSASQNHSRLTQWKMPTFEKDDVNDINARDANVSTEFSRAPGSVSKSSSANSLSSSTAQHSNSVLQPLSENTWGDMPPKDTWNSDANDPTGSNPGNGDSTVGDIGSITCDGAANKLTSASDKESPINTNNPITSSSSQSYNFNDLVPEFEPGKPWKGSSRIKNFEDDPHVTPGSIAKSPLSLNSIKDSELFSWNTKSNAPGQNASSASSLTTSTWSFSPPPSAVQTSNTPVSKQNSSKSWGPRAPESNQCWKGPALPKTRGPPPGLAGQGKNSTPSWMYNEGTPQNWPPNCGWEKQSGSNFLVLRNLTPQIDGSTLKTLCSQHGPLQLFHLLLNHGIALVRYSTREESDKARCALNNCVFSNTTILVDIPTEAEVKQYLQLAGGQNISWSQGGNADPAFSANASYPINSSNSNGASSKANWKGTTNLNLPGSNNPWSFSGSGTYLWGMQPSTTDQDNQSISSSLNSFLPDDLLGGGESI